MLILNYSLLLQKSFDCQCFMGIALESNILKVHCSICKKAMS